MFLKKKGRESRREGEVQAMGKTGKSAAHRVSKKAGAYGTQVQVGLAFDRREDT